MKKEKKREKEKKIKQKKNDVLWNAQIKYQACALDDKFRSYIFFLLFILIKIVFFRSRLDYPYYREKHFRLTSVKYTACSQRGLGRPWWCNYMRFIAPTNLEDF